MSNVRKRHLSDSPEPTEAYEKKRLREDDSQTADTIQADLDALPDATTTATTITGTVTTPQPSTQTDGKPSSQPTQAPRSPQPSSVPSRKVAFSPDTQSTPPQSHSQVQSQVQSQSQSQPQAHAQPRAHAQSQRVQMQDSPEPSKPRLVITKMVLNNFKSYAGRQVIGPFHKSFSAIVGPNGSGKSNVIDSLLFVFGYRANKMRQGKLSELIHNSAKHPNCDSCSVEIHFQEIIDGDTPAAFDRVPNSKLVISRFAYRNNASKYYINDKTSSFTEVTTLLRKRGIDLDHKRFLILQGEVESIALMKPKAKDENDDGLLEYLEDIIGTSKYKEPIDEANERLESLNEERMEKLNRVRYVGREKDNLEDKKREAETYLENENELARQKNELYQIFLYEANENIKTATKAIEELKEKLKEEQQNHKGIENEINEMNKTHSNAVEEYQVLNARTDKIYKKHAKFEKEDVQIKERKTHLEAKMEKNRTSMETDREARDKARDAIKTNGDDLTKRKKDIKELEKQLKSEEKKLEGINAELKGKTDGFRAEIEEHQKELAPWTAKVNEKRRAIDVKVSEREILAEKISSGEKAVQNAEEQVKKVEDMWKAKRKEIKAVPKELENLQKAIADLEKELAGVTEKETTLRSKLITARQKADEARGSMQQKQSQGKILDSLLRMRDSGRIKGIHDRMGNLGVIDDKYDVAISTACPALDNIVVDTVEAGQACIEYLRKNGLGRAVFTVLDKLGHQDMRAIETPENVPRLFDLVKPKSDKFAPAFYSVLRDTLVADSLQQANRIAYGRKRWRVVALDGKLIEKSGAMTGGGHRQQRGAMGSKFRDEGVSAEAVAELERERDKLEQEMRELGEQKRAAELSLNAKKDALPRKRMEADKLQMDIDSLDRQIKDEHERLKDLKTHTKPSPEDVKRHEDISIEIEGLEQELNELKEKTSEIEGTISSLQEEIMDAGGMDLRLQKIVVEDVRKRIDNLNNRITKAMVAKAKAEKDVTKLESTINKTEQEVQKIQEDLKSLEEESLVKSQEAAKVLREAEESKKQTEAKKAEVERIKKDLDEKTAEINSLRKSEVEIKNKLEDYQRSETDNKRRVANLTEQISKLSLNNYNDAPEEKMQLKTYNDEELDSLQDAKEAIKIEIAELEAYVQSAKPNLSVLDEYKRRQHEYDERTKDLDEITTQRDTVKSEVDRLRKQRLDEFMQGFNVISQKLKEMYQMITMGGNAELELVDSLDPFSEGIVFSVMPPKKSWKNISNLSGGEKTLSSLALVFALHHFKPTPLYVMDEIDAALDFRNVSIVANYIAERTRNAQFVIISLRNNMFELANRLVGIYKTTDCTKSIAINPNMMTMLTAVIGEQPQQQQTQQQQPQVSPAPAPVRTES